MTKTRTQLTIALASAAVILAMILAISPRATIIANDASGEVLGIDILGLTKNATDLPEQQYAAH
jgi:hypothetical protein